MARKCPECGTTMRQRCFEHVTKVGSLRVIDKTAALPVCDFCGTAIISDDQMEAYELNAVRVVLQEAENIDGTVMRFARKALGMTQKELAKCLETNDTQVSRWESEPQVSRRIRLALLALVELSIAGGSLCELATNRSENLEVKRAS